MIPPSASEGAQDDYYEQGEFSARIEHELGEQPDWTKFRDHQWCLRDGNLLEIGPGTGHFLAAARDAGLSTLGIEGSAYHREYIHRKWDIETIADPLEKNTLAPETFDNCVSFNCLEHIYDPASHFAAVFRVLKPGGRFLISTCNADALVARLVGRYWSTFKPADHVSVPSPKSLRIIGDRTGFRTIKLWCEEYPLETPAGFAVAMRDWLIDVRQGRNKQEAITHNSCSVEPVSAGRRLGRRLIKARAFGWIGALVSRFMLAGSVKVLYEKPGRILKSVPDHDANTLAKKG